MTPLKPRASRALAWIPIAAVLLGATDAQPIRTDTAVPVENIPRLLPVPAQEHRLTRASPFLGDVRALPNAQPRRRERPEREPPEPNRVLVLGKTPVTSLSPAAPSVALLNAPAPSPIFNFDGLDFANWGDGHPPDTNGDVGPTYYIETVNTSVGIYNKLTGNRVAAFKFDALMSQGHFGNLCDTDNFGDPIVVYDTFEDRWIITDFAFKLDSFGNVVNPPGNFQCFAVSRSGDPVSGGWNFYSINTTGGLGDYPKFGIWPDGLYMSANMFDYAATGSFQNPRVYAFNKAQMYAGAPTVQVVSSGAPSSDFTLLPANARLQTGTPPPGTPNYYVSTWDFLNALTVYQFHVDWDRISLSTFTGPDIPLASTSWPNADVANAPSLNGNSLDVLEVRAMMQNQYTNIAGAESLWLAHTVRRQDVNGFAAPRWYQVNVTGGTVWSPILQATTWDPDGTNVMYRFLPSVAVDRAGNMALGYSTSSSTTKPAIKYAGRLASDAPNTFSQTEQVLIQGTGTQKGNCGGSACTRWGDYSAMSLDPDGCTFWYANEYYATDGLNDLTRIGAFAFPNCTPIANAGSLQGTVTSATGGPISGATVAVGTRTATTDANGFYSFAALPPGTYPSVVANAAGFFSSSTASVAVGQNGTTTKDFTLTPAPRSACLTDTTQADFVFGVPTNTSLSGSPGDVILVSVPGSGTFESARKDANPAPGFAPAWTAFSWNAAAPPSSAVLFQAAASNSANGPFDFVGPDGTSATFFSSGASLAQFNGSRYLKYKAALSSTFAGSAPAVNDVTVCFEDVQILDTSVSVDPANTIYGGTVNLSATLFANGAGLSGRVVAFAVNGTSVGSVVTLGNGVAILPGISLAGTNAGSYANAVTATYAGEFALRASTGSSDLTIAKAPQAISFGPLPDKVATDEPFAVSATGGDSGNRVVFSTTSPACSVTDTLVRLLVAGTCAVDADQQGNVNYSAAPRVTQAFQVALGPQSITFPAVSSFPWRNGSAELVARASSFLPIVYGVLSGPCAISGSTLTATAAGTCTVAAAQPGNARYAAAPTVTVTVTVDKASQAITFPAASSFAWPSGSATLHASANSGLGITYTVLSGPCNVTDNVLRATAAGTCVVAADQGGNDNYVAAPRVTINVVVTDTAASSSGCGCHSSQTSGAALEIALLVTAVAMRRRRSVLQSR